MNAAIGFRARTGLALVVSVAGSLDKPVLIESTRIPLLPEGCFAPYHAAETLAPAAADKHVKRDIAAAHRLAEEGMRAAVVRCARAGHEVLGCGALVGKGMPEWSTAEILAVHFRMHKAEGELFRTVLATGAKALGLPLVTLPDASTIDAAAKALRVTRARLDATLAALGRQAGPPWRTEQKEAAALALVALMPRTAARPAP